MNLVRDLSGIVLVLAGIAMVFAGLLAEDWWRTLIVVLVGLGEVDVGQRLLLWNEED